jgi:hypothetical protein
MMPKEGERKTREERREDNEEGARPVPPIFENTASFPQGEVKGTWSRGWDSIRTGYVSYVIG